MLNIYENKYSNPLLLNLIKVRYSNSAIIEDKEYTISLNNANNQYGNNNNIFKVMLYLCNLLTDNGLNDNTYTITRDDITNMLGIANTSDFKGSLDYISSISYSYKLFEKSQRYYVDKIISSYKHFRGYFRVVFTDEFMTLLDRQKQFYQMPKSLLKANTRYYRHSLFIGNYIQLHKRRNKGKDNENIISVKELFKICPTLPNYDELSSSQKHTARAIITPFEKNLQYACDLIGVRWKYNTFVKPNNYIAFSRAKIELY